MQTHRFHMNDSSSTFNLPIEACHMTWGHIKLNWYFLMPDLVVALLSEEFMNRGKNGNGGSKL